MKDTTSTTQDARKSTKPLTPKIGELIAGSRSLILGTVDAGGNPNASYAPFARVGNTFYILVSFMARHTKNLRDIGKVSVMFIEDESGTKQIYARERLTIDASGRQVERGTAEWDTAIEALKGTHGKILDMLTGMDDFIMIGLQPLKGAYVNGFGSAYFVDENLEIVRHRNDAGHVVRTEN